MKLLRVAFRQVSRNPGFTLAAVITLALGIGANTAIFSTLHAILLRPLPYPESGRIMFLSARQREQPESTYSVNYADLLDWQRDGKVFESLGGALDAQMVATGDFEAVRLKGAFVSPITLELLRTPTVLGRPLRDSDNEPGSARVCVLSDRAWERFFQRRSDALGKSITLNGHPHEVVGIMPPRFKFWDAWFYVPILQGVPAELRSVRGVQLGLWGIGRLRPGVTPQEAEAALDVISRRIEAEFPVENRGVTVRIRPLAETVGGALRPTLLLLFGAVAAVLLIACVNVANLFLARGAGRVRELALRSALGASRGRLVRDLLLETVPIGVLAAVAGLLLGQGGLKVLLSLIPAGQIPAEASIGLNGTVLAYTLILGLGTAILSGILPAWHGARDAVNEVLKDGGRAGTGLTGARVRSGLIVAEVALALALLVGAGLLIRNLAQVAWTDPGFRTREVLVAALDLPETKYPDPARSQAFVRNLIERASALAPGVRVGVVSSFPLLSGSINLPFLVEGRPFDRQNLRSISYNAVRPGTHEILGIPLRRGRHLLESDRVGTEPVVVINEAAARQFFGEEDPVGRLVVCGIPAEMAGDNPSGFFKAMVDPPPARVVGVVADSRQGGLTVPPQPEACFPFEQSFPIPPIRNSFHLVLQTPGDPRALIGSLRQEVRRMDPDLPVDRIKTMEGILDDSLSSHRFVVVLLGAFAAVALVLATVGIYSVVAWLVSQRTREMGIRIALGADPRRVTGLVVAQGLKPVGLGLLLGVGLALGSGHLVARQLDRLTATDPATYLLVAVLLTAIAAAACWVPARRASRVSPTEALRAE